MPIFWLTGPPAAGKSTLAAALSAHFDRCLLIPVDDLRGWVASGFADSVPWTDETERQFQIAEGAVCDLARRYHEAGFTVVVDHCRNMPRLEQAIQANIPDLPVVRVCLMPDLDVNLTRSHTRTNKPFDPHLLDETIVWTNSNYRNAVPPEWSVIDNSRMTVDETLHFVLSLASEGGLP